MRHCACLAGVLQVELHPYLSAGVRAAFLAYVQREASDKQAALAEFQQKFNAVDIDLRSSAETRAELLLRCDELRDVLWDKCDRRNVESEQQLQRVRWGACPRQTLQPVLLMSRKQLGQQGQEQLQPSSGLQRPERASTVMISGTSQSLASGHSWRRGYSLPIPWVNALCTLCSY